MIPGRRSTPGSPSTARSSGSSRNARFSSWFPVPPADRFPSGHQIENATSGQERVEGAFQTSEGAFGAHGVGTVERNQRPRFRSRFEHQLALFVEARFDRIALLKDR